MPTRRSVSRRLLCLSLTLFGAAASAEPLVRISTVEGDFVINLTPQSAPATVDNFLNYVSRGDYSEMFIHRSAPGFVLQGGGFAWPEGEANPVQIPADPPVVNEFNVSNTRGTVAMAKLSGDPDSATNQWFVNLEDNGANLDNQNGGFTVFGTIDSAGMQVVDDIAALERVNAGGAFNQLPVINFSGDTVLRENVVLVFAAEEFPSSSVAPGAAVLPAARSVAVDSPATAFATLLNTSDVAMERCRIAPRTDVPAAFSYRQTNPATNEATGPDNPLVSIAPGAAASFVFSLTPSASFASTDIEFVFTCGTTPDAATVVGVNTFNLAASVTASADVIALAATLGNDGIVDIAESTSAGAFSVATVNLGSTETITVSADSGTADLGLALFVCATDEAGDCEAPPAASVTRTMGTDDTATFAVFVNGTDIDFDPAANRVFVRFAGVSGAPRGRHQRGGTIHHGLTRLSPRLR